MAAKFKEELNQSTENKETKNEGIQHMKVNQGDLKEKMGKQSTAWPVYQQCVYVQHIGGEARTLGGDLKGSEIMAAQNQVLQTEYHVIKILQTETESKCRL